MNEVPNKIQIINQKQLQSLKDSVQFSLETWVKQTGILNKQQQSQKIDPKIFSKYQTLNPQIKKDVKIQQQNQINLDQNFELKINNHKFYKYIKENVVGQTDQQIQQNMKHQKSLIKLPLLRYYPIQQYSKDYQETFNCILKIGGQKNSGKKIWDLLNIIVKPIHQSYKKQYQSSNNLFQDQPTLYPDYSSNHNLIKDQIFLQFIKQLMNNSNQESMLKLMKALGILTKYYYPSPMFIYQFLSYMKTIKTSTNINQIDQAYQNTLIMAQALEGNKGNKLSIYQNQIKRQQNQYSSILYLRKTHFTERQIINNTISIHILNNQQYRFKIRNQTLQTFLNKILTILGYFQWRENFGIYLQQNTSKSKTTKIQLLSNSIKAIDLVNTMPMNSILYLKIKQYFPFRLKDLNLSRLVYLNMIHDQLNYPWEHKEYQVIVAHAMLFDQFDQIRISNYLKISKQTQSKNPNLKGIQQIYGHLLDGKQKKICEYEYFRYMKNMNFFLCKAYHCQGNYTICLKPKQINIYQNSKLISSIDLQRIGNVTVQNNQIICQIKISVNQKLENRILKLKPFQHLSELYQNLTYYLEKL